MTSWPPSTKPCSAHPPPQRRLRRTPPHKCRPANPAIFDDFLIRELDESEQTRFADAITAGEYDQVQGNAMGRAPRGQRPPGPKGPYEPATAFPMRTPAPGYGGRSSRKDAMTEREGFEPSSRGIPDYAISSRAP